ncbi:glycosyltransferase family 39 protein [Thiospirillum jenense]|uniref:Glycosyltransferase family 39 protein n=1 Tax=Thiospirillum jenense TaxID=1653858 RepID=A0A839HJJ6_9GAMM|nr:glycosyltransferase family 39 protein [Thiospirillum jenense]MBB1126142.1 glycosyltransferase family 39 protein [Thiospirillum jenense]
MSHMPRSFTVLFNPARWSITTLLWSAVVLITLASLWRFVHLDHLLVWHDEVYSIIRVLGYSIDEIFNYIFVGQLLTPEQILRFQHFDGAHGWIDTFRALIGHPEHGPLYYLFGRLILIFPLEPVVGLRAVAALMSALLPPAVFWLMRELFGRTEKNWPVAWVAAALIAVSPLYVLFAHEARQYTLWLLLLLVSTAAFLRALRSQNHRWWWLYSGLMLLSFYTHLLSALTVCIHACYGLLYLYMTRVEWKQSRTVIRSWLLAIAVATLLFTPWLAVIFHHQQLLTSYTSWMSTTVSVSMTFQAWGAHFIRAFIDFDPSLPTWLLVLLLPMALAIGVYVRHAPRPAVWLFPLFAVCFIGVVLIPDLLFGGMRSLQMRYALPAVLAVQCMIAWTVGIALIPATQSAIKPLLLTPARARVVFSLLIAAGIVSLVVIDHTPTWWNKNYSENNRHVANLINAHPASLLFISNSAGVSVGEVISIAYHLNPDVRIWAEPLTGVTADVLLPTTTGERFALLPWTTLIAAFAPDQVTLIDGSWQWFRVESLVSEPPLISSAHEEPAPPDIALPTEQLPNQTPPSIAE